MFCQKCGAILVPKKEGKGTQLACSCGYVAKKKEEIKLVENVQLAKADFIEVVDKRVETLPRTKEECPKCKNPEAYYWLVQTRAGDEAETRFFKCVKCAHTWRAY
ncbi:MAG TPA: transcription factor S [Candidatus Nanoarchaeia archaeon]|nr:transcription factor S [Candidatus Nanoarchaeia archaeon]